MTTYKILIGSKCIGFTNARDIDTLTIHTMAKTSQPGIYAAKRDIDLYIHLFKTKKLISHNPFGACVLYMLSNGFHEQEMNYPFRYFNVLDYPEAMVHMLQLYINTYDTSILTHASHLPKQFYHLVYQYYMLQENTHYISAQGFSIVQKIHDFEMPVSYFYELRNLINAL